MQSSCFASYSSKELTLEEKIGQVLMVHFHGELGNEEARTLIQKHHVGGIIYYNWANGLHSPLQVLRLSNSLQKIAQTNRLPIPLFIAVDQEGGVVSRLAKGFTVFPGNRALGETSSPELAESCAEAIGRELQAVGVNFNLAPVVDVNNNPCNPIIGVRSFSDSAPAVVSMAKKTLKGYQKANIITSLKHFPGHGDVQVDSHQDLPSINKSKQEMQSIELLPFIELAEQADAIMTAHLLVPTIDPIHCATLSKKVLNIARENIGFRGVIISDSLVMEGLLKNCESIDDAAIRALNAGCDILLLGGKQLAGAHVNLELTVEDVARIHQTLVHAVQDGIVSEKRLDEAVQRILDLKKKHHLSFADRKEEEVLSFINTPEHQLLGEKIASLALRTIENQKLASMPIAQLKVAVFASDAVKESMQQTSLLQIGKENASYFFKGLNPNKEEIEEAVKLAEKADVLVLCTYNAWKNNAQMALYESLLGCQKPLAILALRDPLDNALFPKAHLLMTTHSPTAFSIEAACRQLIHLHSTDLVPMEKCLHWKLNTSNQDKFEEFKKLFARHGYTLDATHINVDEILADSVQVVAHKASQMDECVLIEDTSLIIEGAEVGVNIRWLLDRLPEHIGKKAIFEVLLAYHKNECVYIYQGAVEGKIVAPRGNGPGNFGFDRFFMPEGSDRTLAEEKPDQYNARAKAVEAFAEGRLYITSPLIKNWEGPWQ